MDNKMKYVKPELLETRNASAAIHSGSIKGEPCFDGMDATAPAYEADE